MGFGQNTELFSFSTPSTTSTEEVTTTSSFSFGEPSSSTNAEPAFGSSTSVVNSSNGFSFGFGSSSSAGESIASNGFSFPKHEPGPSSTGGDTANVGSGFGSSTSGVNSGSGFSFGAVANSGSTFGTSSFPSTSNTGGIALETSGGFAAFASAIPSSSFAFCEPGSPFSFSNSSSNSKLPSRLNNATHKISGLSFTEYFNDKSSADMVLKFENKSLYCHKFILSIRSSVLKDSIQTTKHEANEDGIPVINLPLSTARAFEVSAEQSKLEDFVELMIKTCYGIDVEYSGLSATVNLFAVAQMLQITKIADELKQKLVTLLKEETEENRNKLLEYAIESNNENLLWVVLELMDSALKCDKLASLPRSLFQKVIEGNKLKVDNEDQIFQCVEKWIEKNKSENEHNFLDLWNCVRFPHLTPSFQVKTLRNFNMLTNEQKLLCMQYNIAFSNNMKEVTKELENAEQGRSSITLNFTPRIGYTVVNIDLLFMCDTTGSMSGEIAVAQSTIKNIMSELKKKCKGTIRFSLIAYKDHSDSKTVQSFPFTENLMEAKQYVDQMEASGGGDTPEAVATALYEATRMKFSENARKIGILIADAPPHGMGSPGDTLPNGDPNGHDWIELGDKFSSMGVTFFTLVCNRAQNDNLLTLFMDTLAQKTDGRCILLSQAEKLPDLLINSTMEDLEIECIVSDYLKNLTTKERELLTKEEISKLIDQHVQKNKVSISATDVFVVQSSNSGALKELKSTNSEATALFGSSTSSTFATNNSSGFSFGSTSQQQPSFDQIKKATNRFFNSNH